MQDEAAALLDRAARQHADARRLGPVRDVQLSEQVGEGDLAERAVDDEAQRAVLAVRAEVDDRPLEARIAHLGHRDEELPREGAGRLVGAGHGRWGTFRASGAV
jgi:hypothetical protein